MIDVLDEGALANDIVRLLGGENQRLKRELREAQQRAQSAESQIRALVAASTIEKVRSDYEDSLRHANKSLPRRVGLVYKIRACTVAHGMAYLMERS